MKREYLFVCLNEIVLPLLQCLYYVIDRRVGK